MKLEYILIPILSFMVAAFGAALGVFHAIRLAKRYGLVHVSEAAPPSPTSTQPRQPRCADDNPDAVFKLSKVYMDRGKTWFFVDRYRVEFDKFVSYQTFSSTDGIHWFNTKGGRRPNVVADKELCVAFEMSVRSGAPVQIGRPFDRRRGSFK